MSGNSTGLILALAVSITAMAHGPSLADSSIGEKLYFKSCAVCHGSDGAGAMPRIGKLGGKDGPLSKSDAELVSVIMKGVDGTGPLQMPAKGGDETLTPALALEIVRFMRKEFAQ